MSKEIKQTEGITCFELNQIGVIRTPYTDSAPYQPMEEDEEISV